MKEITVKITWNTEGLSQLNMEEGIRWYLKDLKGNHTIEIIKQPIHKKEL